MIRLVAFDMDGTFLNSQNDYDRSRFKRIFKQLQEQGIRVAAISGNQYQQIRSFFTAEANHMTIVSEVGAVIVENGVRIFDAHFEKPVVERVLEILHQQDLLKSCSVSGFKALYYAKDLKDDFKQLIQGHNFVCEEVESLLQLPDDEITLITLNLPKETVSALLEELNQASHGQARAVSSGFGFIDIIPPGVNKGVALDFLARRWGISPNEVMVFGDSGNDLEMLEYATYSYAMEGSPEEVIRAAKFVAPSNNQSGVLEVVEQVLLTSN